MQCKPIVSARCCFVCGGLAGILLILPLVLTLNTLCCRTQDYDDDGEDAAGSRLLHLLQILNVKDTIVVVTRWYGGVKLGPARFTHINNAARVLLEKCGHLNSDTHAAGPMKKKGKRH